MVLEFPCGALALDSPFYVERPPVEKLVYEETQKAGSLIRIKAPRHMGKSSLLLRIIDYAQTLGYKTVSLDFQTADYEVYSSLSKFLRWFCKAIARQLNLPPCLDDYWDDDIGAKLSCTLYFEYYLLNALDTPLLLSLNEVNKIFEHPKIAQDFLPMLRFWYEQAKQNVTFQKLRMTVVHSTEIYVPLNINQSPFNIGLPIHLKPFNLSQVQQLASAYGLEHLGKGQIEKLMDIIGGHPYLLSKAFYYLRLGEITFTQLLETASTQAGIYSEHLRGHLIRLQREQQLVVALKQVIDKPAGVEIEPFLAHKLYSLGLINISRNTCFLSCKLYHEFFSQVDLDDIATQEPRLQKLEKEIKQLKQLVNIDSLTRIANRRSFDTYLSSEWRRMLYIQEPLSLIMLDIDCFKRYNDTYGHQAGDKCLQAVAKVLRGCLKRTLDLVARYGGEEFAVILPMTDIKGAQIIAEEILEAIKSLKIEHINSTVRLGIITASIGTACIFPHINKRPYELIKAADEALYAAKQEGRNQVSVYGHNRAIL